MKIPYITTASFADFLSKKTKLVLNNLKVFTIIFITIVFCGKSNGQTSLGAAYIWSTTTTWSTNNVPLANGNVTVNHPLTLDQNLTISAGDYTFNQDVTDQPGGANYNFTNSNASGSLTIASGTTTLGGVTSIGGNTTFTLTVKSGATLVLGTPGSTSNNFLIGNKANITIEQGATLIVYGNIVNSNSTGSYIVNGLLQVYGNYETDNGNIDINGTTGQFYTTGSMTTQGGSSTIYGSSNNCTSNCSGTSLGCGTSQNSYTATIAPQSQTVCSGGVIAQMTFSTNVPSPDYEWQYSLTAGGSFTTISGATSNVYTPSPLSVTTWYRVKYTSSASGCGTKYSAPVPVYVSASTYTQSTAGQTVCGGVFGPISVSAFGTSLTYQWYSNNSASNSGGTLITGATSSVYTPSSDISGTKYYYCVLNSSCNVPITTAVSGAFTVNLNSAGAASSSPTTCLDSLMTNISHTTTGATGIGTPTGLPTGVSASWFSNIITISGTPSVSGTFNYSIPLTGGCGAVVYAIGTIIVSAITVGGTVTGGTTICSGNASALLTLVGQTGTVVKWQSSISPFSTWTDITNSSTTYTSGALMTSTQFRAVVQNGNCLVVNSASTTVTVSLSNTWTGTTNTSWFTATNWSCGSVPTAASDVTIPNVSPKPIVDGTNTTALANTLTVNSGSSLTTNSGNTLKVTNAVSNNGGTITFENSASLVQINNITNSGNIIYKRDYTGGEMDYTYWSSPVALQNLLALSPSTKLDKFFSYDGTDWVSENPATTSMTVGKGYTIRGIPPPSGPPPGFDTLSFVGVPNNGNYEISSIAEDRSYLLGNPYASALDADAFLIANKDVINGTLYFWTHNTPIAIGTPDPGSGIWAYSGNDYAAYNATGGVAAINPPDIDPVTGQPYPAQAPSGGAVPSGKIASGQGFFGSSKGSLPTNPKIVYDNAMRVGVSGLTGNNSQFFKIKNTKVASQLEKHRIWLDLTNIEGAFKQTLVGYITDATNEYDDRFDGESYDGNDFLDFYSISNEKNLTIQGRALPFNENDEVPLGYRVALGGTFTIKIGQKDGLLSNLDIFIEDKLTNTVSNLKSGNYTFKTDAGIFDNRFVLRYANKTLGTEDFDVKENTVLVSIKSKQIKINSFAETIDKVTIYDVLGRQIYQKNNINSNEFSISNLISTHQTVIVKTSLQNGKTVTDKVIY